MSLTDYLAIGAAVLSAAVMVLHVVAPMTKTPVDDELLARLESVEALVKGVLPSAAPAPDPTAPVK